MLFKRVCASEALQSLAPSLFPYVTAYSLTLLKFVLSAPPSLLSVVLSFSLFWCLHLALCFPPFPFSSSGPSPPPPLASALPFCSPDKSPVLLSPLSLSPANFTPTLSLSLSIFPPLKIFIVLQVVLSVLPSLPSFIYSFFLPLCGSTEGLPSLHLRLLSLSFPLLAFVLSRWFLRLCVASVGKRKARHAPLSCAARRR